MDESINCSDSVVSLRSEDISVNDANGMQNELQAGISGYDQLKLIDFFLSIVKNRYRIMCSKYEASVESSRYQSLRNITVVERDYADTLDDMYTRLELSNIFERIFQRSVESVILWDIIKQNISSVDNSFPLPKPPINDCTELESKTLDIIVDIADKSIEVENTFKETNNAIVEHLNSTRQQVEQLENFMLYKEGLKRKKQEIENKQLKELRERQRKYIKNANIVRGIVTKIIGSVKINYLEHPEIVEIIQRCRNIVTEKNLHKECSMVYNRIIGYSDQINVDNK